MAVAAQILALWWAVGCAGDAPDPDFDMPVRSQGGTVIIGGELSLHSSFDDRFRDDRYPPQEARRFLFDLHPTLKGPDRLFGRVTTFVPLGSGIADDDCVPRGKCAGRPELAHSVIAAGIDAVSVASPVIAEQGSAAATASLLSPGVCATGHGGAAPCTVKLDQTRVAFVAVSTDTAEQAPALVEAARAGADVVVLSAAYAPDSSATERIAANQQLADAARPDVLVGHAFASADGVELRDGVLVLHNPGAMLTRGNPPSAMADAFVYRLHLADGKVDWLEGIPIRLRKRNTREAFLAEAAGALDTLLEHSKAPGLHTELNRAILDLP